MTPVAEESGSPEPVSYAATECDLAAGEYPADGEEPLSYPNPGKQKRRFSVFQGFVVIMLLVISAFLMRLVVDANRSRESSQVLTSRLSGSQDDSAAAEDDLSSSSKGSSKKTASPGDALSNSSKGNTPKGSSAKGVKAGTSKSSMPAGSSPIESPTEEGQTTSNKSTSPTRTSVKAGKAKSVDDSADEPDVSEPPPPMQGPPNLFGPPPWYNPYPPPSQGKGNGSKKGDPPGKSGSGYFDGPPYFGPGYQPGHWHWHDDDHWAEYYYETSPGFVTGKGKGKGGGGHWWDHIEVRKS
jgi:cytoskeletal protein RodZ